MKEKHLDAFMDTAYRFAELSTAVRAQVGAIIVKDRRIISIGYNGMPSGWDNVCEDEVYQQDGTIGLKTKPEVLHAEANAIAKLAQSPESARDAVLFCTHMPCMECAKLIHQSGIRTVYYGERYEAAKGSGEQFLSKSGIKLSWLPQKPKPVKTVEKVVEVERVVNTGEPLLFGNNKLLPPDHFYKIFSRSNELGEILTVNIFQKIALFHISAKYNWDILYSDVLAISKLYDITDWVIDYSYEAHILQADNQRKGFIFEIIHDTIEKLNLKKCNWHLIHGNYYVNDMYTQWCEQNNIEKTLRTVDHLPTLFFHRYYKTALKSYKSAEFRKNFKKTPTRYYSSFNGRAAHDRVGLLKFLHNNNLLDLGYSTWHFDPEAWQIIHSENPDIKQQNILPSGIEPVKHFKEISTAWNYNPEQELINCYTDSCFEIVVETITNIEQETYNWDSLSVGRTPNRLITDKIAQPNTVFLTEKTARPLLWGMPFFLNAGQGSLAALRELGFETFSDLWDESYDEIADPDQRAAAMHASIQSVLALSLSELSEKINSIKPKLLHNQQRFQDLAQMVPIRIWTEAQDARTAGFPGRRVLSQLAEPNGHIRIRVQ
jgi:dCMP deaminase